MTTFKSEKQTINVSSEKIFSFLADFNNFEKLMPEQVTNWQSTIDTCSFTISGMVDLAMVMGEKSEHSFISYKSASKKPFNFDLNTHISEEGGDKSVVEMVFNADLNPMLKMMASRPLQNLINMFGGKLKEIMEA
ncbi:MAG: hypothetical protein R2764_24010 [Bacteroidales bacterium]